MFFSNHEGGLWIGARAIKAKWNGAYDDSTPWMPLLHRWQKYIGGLV
jgi:hypothetical protein